LYTQEEEPASVKGNTGIRRAAERYLRSGVAVIPIPAGEKNPDRRDWQNERWTVEAIPRIFNNGQNIGALLGEPSGGLVDIDLDVPAVLRVAGRFLEPTKTTGRTSAPDSHWLYYCDDIRSQGFEDLDGTTILEIRSTGRQTVFPPSVHPSGERYSFSDSGLTTARVGREDLLRGCRELATAGLIARNLPPVGGRHKFAMALVGFLLRRGLTAEAVQRITLAAWDASGYPSERDKREARRDVEGIVRDTAEKLARGEEVVGGRTLSEIKPGLARKISRYWGFSERDTPDTVQSTAGEVPNKPSVKMLADAITSQEHFAQDAGGKLYRFSDGTYREYAERYIRRKVKELLVAWGRADKWTSHQASEAVEYIRADAPELWERPPLHEVNVANGILNVETKVLRDHDPGFLSTVQIPVRYDPEARCPQWEKFVAEVFPEDAQDLAFELAADLITPSRSAQKAVLLLGEGANGKSTYLRALTSFVGSTNAAGVSLHKLESDRFAAARLIGKMANICPDLPSTHLTETSVFKAITGGDDLHGEYKYRESFEFRPYCRLVFSANHVPRSGDASHAFFRRWLVIPFERTFEPAEQVPREELDADLSAGSELSGVLNRALEVLPRVRREGFTESASMREAWKEFHAMTDPVSVWIAQNTVGHAEAFVSKDALSQAYNEFCEKTGRAGMNKRAFGRAVKRVLPHVEDGQKSIGGKMTWCWLGLGLKSDGADPTTHGTNETHGNTLIVSDSEKRHKNKTVDGGEDVEETSRGNSVSSVSSVSGDPLTDEEVQRVRQRIREGMKPELARQAVLRKRGGTAT
jgi:putative DNA primase/helicase